MVDRLVRVPPSLLYDVFNRHTHRDSDGWCVDSVAATQEVLRSHASFDTRQLVDVCGRQLSPNDRDVISLALGEHSKLWCCTHCLRRLDGLDDRGATQRQCTACHRQWCVVCIAERNGVCRCDRDRVVDVVQLRSMDRGSSRTFAATKDVRTVSIGHSIVANHQYSRHRSECVHSVMRTTAFPSVIAELVWSYVDLNLTLCAVDDVDTELAGDRPLSDGDLLVVEDDCSERSYKKIYVVVDESRRVAQQSESRYFWSGESPLQTLDCTLIPSQVWHYVCLYGLARYVACDSKITGIWLPPGVFVQGARGFVKEDLVDETEVLAENDFYLEFVRDIIGRCYTVIVDGLAYHSVRLRRRSYLKCF
jgi:hypothetical protein